MGRAKLNLGVTVPRESYFNMIDDSLIKPSTRALRLDEFYFKERATKEFGKSLIVTEAKAKLKDVNSGVYYEPLWDNTMSLNNLTDRVVEAIAIANSKLKKAKTDREEAYSQLAKGNFITIKTARERVDQAIIQGRPNDTITNNTSKQLVNSSVKNIQEWVIFNTVADAYTAEINKRVQDEALVKEAIAKGDVKELETLKGKVRVKELKDSITTAIREIQDRIKAEADAKAQADRDEAARIKAEEDAKKAEEARQKAIVEARIKLASATTPEDKARAQAELDALLVSNQGSLGGGFGDNKMLIYVGIGVIVVVGAYFLMKKAK